MTLIATLSILAFAANGAAADLRGIDQLYFHRDQNRNLGESISRLHFLLEKTPDDPELLWRLGRSLVRAGELQGRKADKILTFKSAERAARKAVALEPRQAEAHFWLGVSIGRRGQAQGIVKSLFLVRPLRREMRTVIRLDPGHGGAHHVLGAILSELPALAGGNKKAALREFQLAVSLSPDYTVNYVALAKAYAEAGDKAKARETLRLLFGIKRPADPAQAVQDLAEGRKLLSGL